MKILYFVAEPSQKQLDLATQYKMAIRNPQAYSPSDYLESCDFVYGDVPQAYLDRFPVFECRSQEKTEGKSLKIDDIKALLTEKGINFDDKATKNTLLALWEQHHDNGNSN